LYTTVVITFQVYQTARVQEHFSAQVAEDFMSATFSSRRCAVLAFLWSIPAFLAFLLCAVVSLLDAGDLMIFIPVAVVAFTFAGVMYAVWTYRQAYLSVALPSDRSAPRGARSRSKILVDQGVQGGLAKQVAGKPAVEEALVRAKAQAQEARQAIESQQNQQRAAHATCQRGF
jgi:hypothetical protein